MSKCVRLLISLGLLYTLMGSTIGCSSDPKKADSAEGLYNLAQDFDKEERYIEAISRYQEVKNKYPYSTFATKSELALADAYFKQESFGEAQVAYQNFKELHPKHSQIDYVTYRVAYSYFKQLPDTIDRDLGLAGSAITGFEELIRYYPSSEFVGDAKKYREEAVKMLAQKEEYIADFYFKKKIYDSALKRYEGLQKIYGTYGFEAKALARQALCHLNMNQKDQAVSLIQVAYKLHPEDSNVLDAKKEIE